MRRPLALAALAALAVLALSGCEARLVLGTSCVRTSDCAPPLSCLLGRCRTECVSDRDCTAGLRCVRTGTTTSVCTTPEEERCTADLCPAPLRCVGGQCRNECVAATDCVAGASCVAQSCVSPPAGDAGPGDPDAGSARTLCSRHGDCPSGVCAYTAGVGVCVAACTAGSCGPDELCAAWADRDDASRDGCSPSCVPGTDAGCPSGAACAIGYLSAGPEQGPAAYCRALGPDPVGCTCTDGDSGANCAAGLVCTRTGAVPHACVVPCVLGTTCASGATCLMFEWSIVAGGDTFGYCPLTERTATGCSLPPPP